MSKEKDKDIKVRKQMARSMLLDYLKLNKLKRTEERFEMLDAMHDINKPVEIATLYEYLCDKGFKLSYATVYNNLLMFEKAQLVVRNKIFGRRALYRLRTDFSNKVYLICKECGIVRPYEDPRLSRKVLNHSAQSFDIEGFSLNVYGTCHMCVVAHRKRQTVQLQKTAKAKAAGTTAASHATETENK